MITDEPEETSRSRYLKLYGDGTNKGRYPRQRLLKGVPKYSDDDVANLLTLVVEKQRDINFNPALTHPAGAQRYLAKRKLDKWSVLSGDFDNDINTPDNVIVLDDANGARFVDGYSIGSGKRKKQAALVYPHRQKLQAIPTGELRKQYKKYLMSPEGKDGDLNNFAIWREAHPKKATPYNTFIRVLSDNLKYLLNSANISLSSINYVPYLSHVAKLLIDKYKQSYPPQFRKTKTGKLIPIPYTSDDYVNILQMYPLNNQKELPQILNQYTKNKTTLIVPDVGDPFDASDPAGTYERILERGTPTVRTKAMTRQPRAGPRTASFIPQPSTFSQQVSDLPDDSTLFENV
jgi:hypothetical protein